MPGRYDTLPPFVFSMLLANALVFVLQQMGIANHLLMLMLWPLEGPFAPWQLVTYGFMHGSILHLFVNMFALWMFGVAIENTLGTRAFAVYYFVCLIGAGIIQLVVSSMLLGPGSMPYPTIGASGAVFGILLAFGMMFPNQTVILLFPPIPMKAKWFVIIFGAIELWSGVTGYSPGVAHFAHLGGMAFGFALIQYWRGKLPVKPRRRLNL